ncbi:hypothetical protein [Stenotrophomonas maltophilia]|uniref:hypothetical protein n=1 Tax=Stenotrophomonas maltophilia TaxID=40324 RepID=UPI00210EC30C|nr:hypothetical protein [Stenotrophomonas maltophilia]
MMNQIKSISPLKSDEVMSINFDKDAVTVLLSIATILIALSQMKIASSKARLDLYNKRFAIYTTALEYYQALWGKTDTPIKVCEANMIKAFRESKFLFKSSDGIYETLEKIKDAGAMATGTKERIEKMERETPTDAHAITTSRENRSAALQRFEDNLKTLEQQLEKYLRFNTASGWSFLPW